MDIYEPNHNEIQNIFSMEHDCVFEDDWVYEKGKGTSINIWLTSRSEEDEYEDTIEL